MTTQTGRRFLILDTSVLVHDPNCIEGFPDDTLIISSWVLDELDHFKRSEGERGEHARQASRNIYEYSANGDLYKGVATKSGGVLKAATACELLPGMGLGADNKTISLAKQLQQECPHCAVVVVSKDINLRIKASMFGVRSGDYEGKNSAHDPYAIFPGCTEIILDSREPIDELHRNDNNAIAVQDVARASSFALDSLIPNQCVYFRFEDKDTLAIYKKKEPHFRLVQKPKTNGKTKTQSKGVHPVNCEQAFAYSLLMDPEIKLVALVGSAGSGKTLMSLLGAKEQLRNEFERRNGSSAAPLVLYDQIVIFRPNVEMGSPLGFLPGTLQEKFEPWMYPIFDNLDLILHDADSHAKGGRQSDPVDDLLESGLLEMNPINHVRGRSFHDKFIIIDEAQNLTRHEIRSLITRTGKGSKVVLTGDISQIDHWYLDQTSNGLSHVISQFIGQDIFGYTIMKRGEERSLLAKLASELL